MDNVRMIQWSAVDASPMGNLPDADSPELTSTQFKQLMPLAELLPGFATTKTHITIMLDDGVLGAYKARAGARGYQTLINETLRQGLQFESMKEQLRAVIREEIHAV